MAYLVLKETWNKNKPFLALRRVYYSLFGKKKIKEEYIKVGNFLVIRGGKGSGKTRELKKLAGWSKELFGCYGVYFSATEKMTEIFRKFLSSSEMKKLPYQEKIRLCLERVKDLAVFIDDIDKISGYQKKDFIKGLIINSKAGAVAFEDEKFVYSSLIQEIRKKQGLKHDESLRVIDLGVSEEVKDIGIIVGVVVLLIIAFMFRMPELVLLGWAFRWLVYEARDKDWL